MNLEVATKYIAWGDLAKTFTAMTGKSVKYISVTMEELFNSALIPGSSNENSGHSADRADSTLRTYKENSQAFGTSGTLVGKTKVLLLVMMP